jgi:hypothetical protein
MWKCKNPEGDKQHKVSLHEVLLRYKSSQYAAKGHRVVRLDRSYTPDAVIIDWARRKVVALEIEIGRGTGLYFRKGNKQSQKTNRAQFDNVIVVYPTHHARTTDEYMAVQKLRKSRLPLKTISEKTGVPIDTIRDWLYRGRKPYHLQRTKILQNAGITLEQVSLKGLGVGEHLEM